MRVGFVQTEPRFGEVAENLERVRELLADPSADLWVLPELFATGYQFVSREEVEALAEPIPHGATVDALVRLAEERTCHIVAGLAERGEHDRLYNTAVLVGPGGVLAGYRKIHLFAEEKRWFHPGDATFPVADVGQARIGMMICFDHLFPESARTLALAGADLIAHPSNLVMPVFAQVTMRARALENGVFTITANRVGTEGRTDVSLTYTGESQIVAPDGNILVKAPAIGEATEIVKIDVSQARDKAVTAWNDRLRDRRPELYAV
ncbi:MAG: acyltransferase [Candidatus Bipolaricaulota bacterium]|nr:MAG: acyltransferase [Candidatus Bipolaricaulota bacterium]